MKISNTLTQFFFSLQKKMLDKLIKVMYQYI